MIKEIKKIKKLIYDGIKVNNAKKVIYFLFALEPLTSTSTFNELLTSLKIIIKKNNNKTIFPIKRYLKILIC